MRVDVVDDPAAEVADRLAQAAAAGAHIALSGGSTPRRAYELAAGLGVDWSAATLWFGDERCVGPEDPDSNYGMVRAALLERLPEGRRPRVLRIEGERGADAAAAAYEDLILEHLGHAPRLDLALMGLGPDGHTASLFPGKPAAGEHRRLAAPVPEAGMAPQVPRVTLTLPVFNAAREVVFLIAGRGQGDRRRRRLPRAGRRGAALGPRAPGGRRAGARARPPRRRGTRGMIEGRYLGLDVGGTKVACAILEDGGLQQGPVEPVEKGSTDELVAQLVRLISDHDEDVRAVGIGVPSIVEFTTGRVRHSVNLPLGDVPLRALLDDRTGLPVYVENDASCAALAEAFSDGALVTPHLVMLTIGTGVGGGLVLDGRLYRGATGAAGEVGHTAIGLDLSEGAARPEHFPAPGSLEALAAGSELDRLAVRAAEAEPESALGRRLAADGAVTGYDVVELAQEEDAASLEVLRIAGERLGIGIANAINTFDPLEVVIGGGVSAAGELLLAPARETAARYVIPGVGTACNIRLARHGVEAGMLGAALIAAQEHRDRNPPSLSPTAEESR